MTDLELRRLKKKFNNNIDKVIRKDIKLDKQLRKLNKKSITKRRDI